MKILITGGTGMIGTSLTGFLGRHGHEVVHLGRRSSKGSIRQYEWDLERRTMDPDALRGVHAVVHLAGANMAGKRWTDSRKSELISSRVDTAAILYECMARYGDSVKVVLSPSGSGYYGPDKGKFFGESDPRGNGFDARLSEAWEAAVSMFSELGKRVVTFRIGMVLNQEGGGLKEFVRPVRWFVGAPLGSGDQYISWIHHEDLNRLFLFAIENERMAGAYNATTPYPVTNREMMYGVARTLKRPIWLPPVPAFALKLWFGELAGMVLEGNRLSADKLLSSGFRLQFDKLPKALDEIFGITTQVRNETSLDRF